MFDAERLGRFEELVCEEDHVSHLGGTEVRWGLSSWLNPAIAITVWLHLMDAPLVEGMVIL